MNCDPNTLALAAKCFSCLGPRTLTDIETYLLCQWVGALGPTPPPIDSLLLADDGTFITADDGTFLVIH